MSNTTERPRNCPTCDSPAPERHPAVSAGIDEFLEINRDVLELLFEQQISIGKAIEAFRQIADGETPWLPTLRHGEAESLPSAPMSPESVKVLNSIIGARVPEENFLRDTTDDTAEAASLPPTPFIRVTQGGCAGTVNPAGEPSLEISHSPAVQALESQWIRVEDKLPENFKQVIGYLRPVDYPRSNYSLVWSKRGIWFGMFSDLAGNLKSGEIPEDQVTHWQALPAPPVE